MRKALLHFHLWVLCMSGLWHQSPAQTRPPREQRESHSGLFRPYSLWRACFSFGFVQWDQDASRKGNFNTLLDFSAGFARTSHKSWLWGPSFQIDPGFTFVKQRFTPKGSDQLVDTIAYQKERYRFNAAGISLFNRISILTRGKTSRLLHPALYLDIGVMGRLPGPVKWVADLAGGGLGATLTRTTVSLRSKVHGFGFVRFGTTGIAAFAQYQFTSFFRYPSNWLEPPRFTCGIMLELPLFKRNAASSPPIYYSYADDTD